MVACAQARWVLQERCGGAAAGALVVCDRTFFHSSDNIADEASAPALDGDTGQGTGNRRWNLKRDLVGFNQDDDIVRFDLITDLLGPFADLYLGNGFSCRRYFDFYRHGVFAPMSLSDVVS